MLRCFWFSTMATGLAVLSIVRAITIDNHLMPTITDCYERLAIGERLNPDNVYKFFNYKTVAECKQVCSAEKKSCKAFAFGISAKGNATCELSIDAIKETADLKPQGTLHATDFDLYIKKLDCTLVIENNKHQSNDYRPPLKPVTLGNIHSEDEFHHEPLQIEHLDKPPQSSDLGPNYHYVPTPIKDGVQNVQTLVSIASGPQTVLNPIHGILVAQESSYYGGSGNIPPFKPAALSHPYDGHKIRPDRYDRPDPEYDNRPSSLVTGVGYADEGSFGRPHWTADRPELDRLDVAKPYGYNLDRYGDRPSRIPFRPKPVDDSHRPLPNRYGSVIPHPDEYENYPTLQSDYLFQQSHQESFSESYLSQNVRPHTPLQGSQGYGQDNHEIGQRPNNPHERPTGPARPLQGYADENADRDHRRPSFSSQGYHDGNQDISYERPARPSVDNPNDYGHKGSGYPMAQSQSYDDERPVKSRPSQQYPSGYGEAEELGLGQGSPQHLGHYGRPEGNGPYGDRPDSRPYDDEKPLRPIERPSQGYGVKPAGVCCSGYSNEKGSKPIVSHSTGHHGEQFTSIITPIEEGKK